MSNNITILPVKANDAFHESGEWTDVIFWKKYDMQPGFPYVLNINSEYRKPIATMINKIFLVQHNHAERKTIFACSLIYKFSIN